MPAGSGPNRQRPKLLAHGRPDAGRPTTTVGRFKTHKNTCFARKKNKRFIYKRDASPPPPVRYVARTSRGRDRTDSGEKRAYPEREADRPFQSCSLLFISNNTTNNNVYDTDTRTTLTRKQNNIQLLYIGYIYRVGNEIGIRIGHKHIWVGYWSRDISKATAMRKKSCKVNF